MSLGALPAMVHLQPDKKTRPVNRREKGCLGATPTPDWPRAPDFFARLFLVPVPMQGYLRPHREESGLHLAIPELPGRCVCIAGTPTRPVRFPRESATGQAGLCS